MSSIVGEPTAGLEALPPVYQLLLREIKGDRHPDILKCLRKLRPELQRQAEWTIGNFDYADKSVANDPTELRICLLEGLNPFTDRGKCETVGCRIATALQLGRSIGIYADAAIVPDLLTGDIALNEEWDDGALLRVALELAALVAVRPLLESGVFRFTNPFFGLCRECINAFDNHVDRITADLYEDIREEIAIEVRDRELIIGPSDLFGFPVFHRSLLTRNERRALKRRKSTETILRARIQPALESHIRATLNTLRDASRMRATMFSNSRAGLMAARSADGYRTKYREVKEWEMSRSATLPWLGDLSMEQIVTLRQEAAFALPRFRARMARLMSSDTTEARSEDAVGELREEAAEVEQELRALDFTGRTRERKAIGMFGLGVAVYGCAADFMAPGVAVPGVLALLHRLHESHLRDKQKHDSLSARPGYVLVKAKELVRHAGSHSEGDRHDAS